MRDPAWNELCQRRGTITAVAQALQITTSAVAQWRQVPKKRRAAVAAALGVDVTDLSGLHAVDHAGADTEAHSHGMSQRRHEAVSDAP